MRTTSSLAKMMAVHLVRWLAQMMAKHLVRWGQLREGQPRGAGSMGVMVHLVPQLVVHHMVADFAEGVPVICCQIIMLKPTNAARKKILHNGCSVATIAKFK